jgi:DnaJ-class molecular chaperone
MVAKSQERDKPRGKCPLCNGTGVIVKARGDDKVERKCVQCRGTGRSAGGLQRK